MKQNDSSKGINYHNKDNEIAKFMSIIRKKKNWTMDFIAENLHISRQALYNYINCKPIMPEETRNELYKMFNLSEEDKLYADGLFREAEIGMSKANAYRIFDSFIFGFKKPEDALYTINFYENGIKVTLDAHAAFNRIFSNTNLSCELSIINSMSLDILPKLMLFLDAIQTVKIQKSRLYVNIGNHQPDILISIFMNLFFQIPSARLSNFAIYYKTEEKRPDELFHNSILINTIQDNDPSTRRFYWLVFRIGEESNCFAFNSEDSFDFVHSIMDQYIKSFRALDFKTELNFDTLELLERFEASKNVLIKTDICYTLIPLEIYYSILNPSFADSYEYTQKTYQLYGFHEIEMYYNFT